jgi:2-isopropylmalate synthase
VGQVGSQIVLGKHSGRHAFSDTLTKMGFQISGDALNSAFARFKELADRKVELTDADLEAIVAEEMGERLEDTWSLESLEVSGGTVGVPRATVVVMRGGDKAEATDEGDGMIDAACKAIKAATGVDGRLIGFNVSAVTGGVDALGDVIVQLEAGGVRVSGRGVSTDVVEASGGVRVSGRGVSTDVVEASARAYLNAVNKVSRIRARNEVRKAEVGP